MFAPLPPGLDVCVYRIVQESLTNLIKHVGPATAWVGVRFPPGRVELEIVDDGRGDPVSEWGGHGLIGMRERVALFGGQLHAGPGTASGRTRPTGSPVGQRAARAAAQRCSG